MPKMRLIVRERTDKSYELGIVHRSTHTENYFHKFYDINELDEHVDNYRKSTGFKDIEVENTVGKEAEPILSPQIETPYNQQPWKNIEVQSIKEIKDGSPIQKEGLTLKKKERKIY